MTSALEKQVIRKVTMRIMPFIMLLYFVNFLDRVNAGFAALSMNKAIGLSPEVFGFGGSLFAIGYFLFEVPSNLMLVKVGARVWIARVMITWGLVSAGFRVRDRADQLRGSAFLARPCGGGLLSGHHPLSWLLVPFTPARRRDGALHGRRTGLGRGWFADLGQFDGAPARRRS